jgi:hypothetical protein
MIEKDKEWEDYLLSIGVVDLSNDEEIDRKLDEVERADPRYQQALREAIEEVISSKNKPLEQLSKEDLIDWLLSLGD